MRTHTLTYSAIVFMTVTGPPSSHQSAKQLSVVVDDSRPVASAIEQLQSRHGWVITYEDPPYRYYEDLADVTKSVRTDYRPDSPKAVVPRGGRLSVQYIDDKTQSANASAAVSALIATHRSLGVGGQFRLRRNGPVIHVVPSAVRGKTGALEQVVPVFGYHDFLPARQTNSVRNGATTSLHYLGTLTTKNRTWHCPK